MTTSQLGPEQEAVYRQLRERILTARLPPGERLHVAVLAGELGVSRERMGAVVERLVADGLAVERPRRGVIVAEIDVATMVELYAVRAPLEGLSAMLAAERIDEAALALMAERLEEQQRAAAQGDVLGVVMADIAFHRLTLAVAGNLELERTLEPIFERITLGVLGGQPNTWPGAALQEHRIILRALADHDPVAARAAAEEHMALVSLRLQVWARGLEDELADLADLPDD